MANIKTVLACITFFTILLMFSGAVSAANWTVSPGGNIQSVINSASAKDIITVNDNNGSAYTYTVNLAINKNVTLKAKSGASVTLKASNSSKPVITINSGGTGSIIQGFTITGATKSNGIYINGASSCNITGNVLKTTSNGIYLYHSSHNVIQNNNVRNSSQYGIYLNYFSLSNVIRNNIVTNNSNGIYLYTSSLNIIQNNTVTNNNVANFGIHLYVFSTNNTIQNNTVTNNGNGISVDASSTDNIIQYNTIMNNKIYGIYIGSSSFANVHFNIITGNIAYGLESNGGTADATNNWWGSNNPTLSSNQGSDLYITMNGGTITYSPWITLKVTANPTSTNNNSTVTADLTHNNAGTDTSSQGHIPDNTPINFTTTLGTVTSSVSARNGKASATFNRGTAISGTANITVTVNNQTVQTNIIIDAIMPIVTTNLAGGIYNTTKSVTLTASDNLDSNPVIYYSTNNGSTWNHQANTVTLTLNQGITNLKYYAVDAAGNSRATQTINYTIDTTAPTVTINHAGGFYNTYQNVTLNATDNLDPNPIVYYTTDGSDPQVNGIRYTNPITITNITTLRYVAVDAAGNWGSEYTQNYTIDTLTVTANPVSGIYNTTKTVTLTATDNLDSNPVIYYTLNGTAPTTSSTRYTGPITLQMNGNCNIINLKFMAVDSIGYQMPTQSRIYILTLPVVDINTNISYSKIQDAINDALNGDTIEIVNGTFVENLVINKKLTIKSVSGNNVIIIAANSSGPAITINSGGSGSIIQGLIINGSVNLNANSCSISGNTIFGNGTSGIIASNSFNNTIFNNTITSNGFEGIHSSYSSNIISSNIIYGCNSGIYSEYSNDSIISNNLTDNYYGIWTYNSTDAIHFNRITGNTYGLRNDIGTVNATNNWWGSNANPSTNSSIIWNVSGNVIANPWLVLGVNVSSTNSCGNTSVTADLTHNNQGGDTSSQGHVPNGIPVDFSTTFGTIVGSAYTVKGKATTILHLGSTQNATVITTASLDNQSVNATGIISTGVAVLTITSTAYDTSTGQPLNITCNITLNESVTWLSVVTTCISTYYSNAPTDELQVIIDGTVVLDRCIYNNAAPVIDTLTVNLAYPGVSGFNITVTDPNNSTNVTTLNFPGNFVHRTVQLKYIGSQYDSVQSFAIATTDVTSSIVQDCLNQGSNYQSTSMKAAYNAFIAALMVEYLHDQLSDAVAPEYNVSWSRTSPIVVSAYEDATGTYLTLDCDHSMGMTVIGTLGNMYTFNYLTSSNIPLIEYAVMNTSINGTFNSVEMDLINAYLSNATPQIFVQNGFLIEVSGNDFIVIDSETGICRDINIVANLCGSWFDDSVAYERWFVSVAQLNYSQLKDFIRGEPAIPDGKYYNIGPLLKIDMGIWLFGLGAAIGGADVIAVSAAIAVSGPLTLLAGDLAVGTAIEAAAVMSVGVSSFMLGVSGMIREPTYSDETYVEQAEDCAVEIADLLLDTLRHGI